MSNDATYVLDLLSHGDERVSGRLQKRFELICKRNQQLLLNIEAAGVPCKP